MLSNRMKSPLIGKFRNAGGQVARRTGCWLLPVFMVVGVLVLTTTAVDVPRGDASTVGDAAAVARSRRIPERARATDPVSHDALWLRAGKMPATGFPTIDPITVDYSDDEPSRLRRAGLLDGPVTLPTYSVAAGGACTFDIECEDADPCTFERCNMDPAAGAGSGVCEVYPVPPGESGGCDDGIFCNGWEICDASGQCVAGLPAICCVYPDYFQYCAETAGLCGDDAPLPGKLCSTNVDCGGSECHRCRPNCTNNGDSDDTSVCNGDETCDPNGHVVPGVPPCGAGAGCAEKKCSGSPTHACTTDEDCPAGQTCTGTGPVCPGGRCCPPDAQPDDCIEAKLSGCLAPNRWFAAGDGFQEEFIPEGCLNREGYWACPRYTSGIVQIGNALPTHPVAAGPISRSTVSIAPPYGPGVALNRLGDDYGFEDGLYLSLMAVRLVGYAAGYTEVLLEFWAEDGTFIEDAAFRPSLVPAVNEIRFDPPLTIPPLGRISVTTTRPLGPNAKFVWLSAGKVEEGLNDPGVLFVNDDPSAANFMVPAPGILSWELEGRIATAPLGGCCDAITGSCTNRTHWDCKGVGGHFQGEGSYCSTCRFGANAGASCGRCLGGGDGSPCSGQSDCDAGPGGSCQADNAVCNAGAKTCSNDDNKVCTTDAGCSARGSVCSNRDRSCVLSTDCPPGGICGGAGTCEVGACVSLDVCGLGACCNSSTGACSLDDEAGCGGSGGTFRGLGTTCDPNCCPQRYDSVADPGGDPGLYDNDCTDGKCWTGADNCIDVIPHHVPSLLPGDSPFVITITGNDAYGTSTDLRADACYGPVTSAASDAGWWEVLELSGSCTRVRLDFCCSSSAQQANWAYLWKGCDCTTVIPSIPDPNVDLVLSSGRGAPYCDDDNFWASFGLLGPGMYAYSTLSSLQDAGGPYQMHFVAEACPSAACCKPDGSCVDGLNQLECDALGGTFLAPPQQLAPTPLCNGDPGVCGTGSCCTGPGACADEVGGDPIDKVECDGMGGRYLGGIRCQGGYCLDDARYSCQTATDCATPGPGGGCVSDPWRVQPNPCPTCELIGVNTCQAFDNRWWGRSASDHLQGVLAADDFIAGAGLTQVSQVCVWGSYASSSQTDCSASVTGDSFRVRILRYSMCGLPDAYNVVGSSTATAVRGVEVGAASQLLDSPIDTYGFQLTLTTPITGLVPGELYWLEVSNQAHSGSECTWMWHLLGANASAGNRYSAAGGESAYHSVAPVDYAWCLNGAIETPPEPVHPSCGCSSDCHMETLASAQAAGREWYVCHRQPGGFPYVCDVSFFCPLVLTPPNDACGDATRAGVGLRPFSNLCTTTDGLPTVKTDDDGDGTRIARDVWYQFTSVTECELEVSLCGTGSWGPGGLDTVLALYSYGSSTCPCPLDPQTEASTWIAGNDDGCPGPNVGGPSHLSRVPVRTGQCVTIRVGTWNGLTGTGILGITCGPPLCGDNAAQASNGEECDGVDDALCPGGCNPAGDPDACKCSIAVCPNGTREGAEECDGVDAYACPGLCQPGCTCGAVCGNNFKEPAEECDGADSSSCPARCRGDCTCPPKVCGNNFVDPGEECDGLDDLNCGGTSCRPPGDPMGECMCKCGICSCGSQQPLPEVADPNDPIPNATGTKQRYISFTLDTFEAGLETALRVKLTSLHHPSAPVPPGTPSFASSEGQYRYVQVIGTGVCPDSMVRGTDVLCAVLSCTPDYRDWAGLLNGRSLHVTGAEIVPSSVYDVAALASSCAGVEATCAAASLELSIQTARWGNVDGSGTNAAADVNVTDVTTMVNKVKDLATGTVIKPRAQVQGQGSPPGVPDPMANVNVLDIANTVDAVKFKAYPFGMANCP